VPKTVTEIKTWLDSANSRKCILADITYYSGGIENTAYLSTNSFYNGLIEYKPIIVGGVSFSESLSADLNISISYGTIELENTGGTYDSFLTYVWKRRPIKLYLGDIGWSKNDFVLIFDGLVDNLVSSGESQLQLTIVDKLESLNEAITISTTKDLVGPYSVKNVGEEKLLPVLFGEVFNLSPVFVDNGTGFDTGPWTATVSGVQSTTGIEKGQIVTASPSVGKLYGGTTTAVVDVVLDLNSFTYTVPAGSGVTRPEPGSITNLIVGGQAKAKSSSATDIRVSTVMGTGGPIYKITNSSLDELIEVRDKGAPISILNNRSSSGEFTLKYNNFGTITCSARSLASSECTVPNLIKHIVKNYGTNTLTDSDLDLSSIDTNRANYKAGIFVSDRTNILDICNELAKSINCGLFYSLFSITGNNVGTSKLRLIELKMPTSVIGATELDDSLMIEGTLQVSETFSVKPTIKLAYCKNYTVQSSDLALFLNSEHGNLFKDEYWYAESKDSSVVTIYKDTGNVKEEITHLLVTSEAQEEANKRLVLWRTPRQLITATYLPQLTFIQLGETVKLTSNRFNLNNGKPGLVYSINRDWITGLVEIGVLV